MIFSGKKHLVGLDIGSSFIKVAELKPSPKGNRLKKFGISKIPHGAISEGRISDIETVATEIRALFKAQKIKEKNVAISTGGHSVVIKTINMPNIADKELQKSIYSEAEQYIPYDIDDVNIDYQVLGESEVSAGQMNVLLVAVKKNLVAEYIELIQMAGLNPRIIDVDTFALQNIYETLPDQNPEEIVLLVDVGESKTSLNILKGNHSLMMRDNASGTGQILSDLSSHFGISMEKAGTMLHHGLEKKAKNFEQICQSVTRSWCSEIREAVSTFQASSEEETLGRVYLSGGGAFVKGFSERLESELGARVSVLNPFSGLIVDEEKFSPSHITEVGPQSPIALGLALRRVDDK